MEMIFSATTVERRGFPRQLLSATPPPPTQHPPDENPDPPPSSFTFRARAADYVLPALV